MQSYMSSVVGIDTQSIVHGRPQQKKFIESHIPMMSSRQLLAPKPPGAQLIDKSIRNRFGFTAKLSESPHGSITVAELSPAQEYEFKRQSRKRMYHKRLETFIKDGICDSSPVDSTCLTRSPLRYLQALLKHEPHRRKAAMMLYPDAFSVDDSSSATESDDDFSKDDCSLTGSTKEEENIIRLKDLVEPLTRWACPTRTRYAYQDAEPTQENRCRVCKSPLQL